MENSSDHEVSLNDEDQLLITIHKNLYLYFHEDLLFLFIFQKPEDEKPRTSSPASSSCSDESESDLDMVKNAMHGILFQYQVRYFHFQKDRLGFIINQCYLEWASFRKSKYFKFLKTMPFLIQAIPIRAKIVIDRLLTAFDDHEIAEIFNFCGWTREEFNRGYKSTVGILRNVRIFKII